METEYESTTHVFIAFVFQEKINHGTENDIITVNI